MSHARHFALFLCVTFVVIGLVYGNYGHDKTFRTNRLQPEDLEYLGAFRQRTPPTWLSALGSEIDHKRDQDWFKFTALRGDKLTIVCDVTSMLNAKLALYYKKKLRQVVNSARTGGDETLVYKCRSSGTFYVKIGFGRGRSGKVTTQASAGSYRLKIVKEQGQITK